MENKNRDSDRDKMLEDILSKLGAQEKNSGRTGGGRAARAAASSANRAASERRSYSSESGGTLNRSASSTGKTSSSYLYDSNISGERKSSGGISDTGRTGSVNSGASEYHKTGNMNTSDRTGVLMNGSAKSKSDLSSAGRKTADNIYEDNNHTSAIKKVQTINPGADVTTHKVKSGKRRRGFRQASYGSDSYNNYFYDCHISFSTNNFSRQGYACNRKIR